MNNRVFIPTLFKMAGLEEKAGINTEAKLSRIYDNNIKSKYMSKPNNRMLFLKLIAENEEVEQYKEKCFASVIFWSEKDKRYTPSKKGSIEFPFGLESYDALEELSQQKYLVLEDCSINKKFAFECWIEQLPIPGKDEGIYAYVDGSSGDKQYPENFGSGYAVTIGKNVYFGHCEGSDSGRNVSAEYLAATKVFHYFPKEITNLKELCIYYDNNNVGYVPVGLYKPGTEYAHAYVEAVDAFQKEYPETILKFIHTDGHSGIYGNEMADQMAERKEKELLKLVAGFEENRAELCPKDGSYSASLTY